MKVRLWKIVTGSLVAAVAIACAVLFLPMDQDTGAKPQGSNMLSLIKPPFVSSVNAAGEGTNFLEEEAGISIYTDIGQSLDLAKAKGQYKTIEKETADYIVGSVSLPNLPETDDVHIFVHKDGWIVVYYLKAEPVSKVIDWNYYSAGKLTSTKLKEGLTKMCNAMGVTATSMNYYHFQYPYANKWMIITDDDSFNLKIPSEFTVYERSISMYTQATNWYRRAYIDGVEIGGVTGGPTPGTTKCWQLTASQLTPDVFHTVSMAYPGQDYLGVALVYKET